MKTFFYERLIYFKFFFEKPFISIFCKVLTFTLWFGGCRPDSDSKSMNFNASAHRVDTAFNFQLSNKRFERIQDYSFLEKDSSYLPNIPWSGYYWSSVNGGIANSWRNKNKQIIYPQLSDIEKMTDTERDNLSPAHKFDIFSNDFSYPTVKLELARTNGKTQKWEGLCHGWATAAIAFKEPNDIKIQGNNKISLTFFSSDIKALLSFNEAVLNWEKSKAGGARCENLDKLDKNTQLPPECFPNAGSFHLALVNSIKRLQKGFVVNTIPNIEVWNFPVYGYSYTSQEHPNGANDAPKTVKSFLVTNTVTYATGSTPLDNFIGPNSHKFTFKETYKYLLNVDANKKIVGGVWKEDWSLEKGKIIATRPSFWWWAKSEFPNVLDIIHHASGVNWKSTRSNNYWVKIKDIYEESIKK